TISQITRSVLTCPSINVRRPLRSLNTLTLIRLDRRRNLLTSSKFLLRRNTGRVITTSIRIQNVALNIRRGTQPVQAIFQMLALINPVSSSTITSSPLRRLNIIDEFQFPAKQTQPLAGLISGFSIRRRNLSRSTRNVLTNLVNRTHLP